MAKVLQLLRAQALSMSVAITVLTSGIGRVLARLAEDGPPHPDALGRERGQAVVRFVVSTLTLVYLIASHYPIDVSLGYPAWLVVGIGFTASALLVLMLTLRDTASSVPRRTAMIGADIAAVTYFMIASGGRRHPAVHSVPVGDTGKRTAVWTARYGDQRDIECRRLFFGRGAFTRLGIAYRRRGGCYCCTCPTAVFGPLDTRDCRNAYR